MHHVLCALVPVSNRRFPFFNYYFHANFTSSWLIYQAIKLNAAELCAAIEFRGRDSITPIFRCDLWLCRGGGVPTMFIQIFTQSRKVWPQQSKEHDLCFVLRKCNSSSDDSINELRLKLGRKLVPHRTKSETREKGKPMSYWRKFTLIKVKTCPNCKTQTTSLWRKFKSADEVQRELEKKEGGKDREIDNSKPEFEGELGCNPCVLYWKLHGVSKVAHTLNK